MAAPSTTTTGSHSAPTTSTLPADEPPVIEDAGLSSEGMMLWIDPTVSDPEGDEVVIHYTLDGGRTFAYPGVFVGHPFDVSEVGYEHTVTVEMRATDSVGNETVETFTHDLKHERTVTIPNMTLSVPSPACFTDRDSVDMRVLVELDGVIEETPVDRTITFSKGSFSRLPVLTGVVLGQPRAQTVEVTVSYDGDVETLDRSHTKSDQVLRNLLTSTPCYLRVAYGVEVTDR
jgi:hypothetical protein